MAPFKPIILSGPSLKFWPDPLLPHTACKLIFRGVEVIVREHAILVIEIWS